MKKTLLFAAAFAALVGCAKETVETVPAKRELVKINALIPEMTKVTLEDKETMIDALWDQDDKLSVIGETAEIFTIAEYGKKSSVFEGVKPAGNVFDIVLPGGENIQSVADIVKYDYSAQTQTGEASLEHMAYNVWLQGVNTIDGLEFAKEWAESHGGSFHQCGAIKVKCRVPEGASTLTKVSVTAEAPVFFKTNDPEGEKVNTLSLTVKNCEMNVNDGIFTAYILTSVNDVELQAGSTLKVSIIADQREYSKTISFAEKTTLRAGHTSLIQLNNTNWVAAEGTKANPVKLYTVADLQSLNTKLIQGDTTYILLMNDIDASGVTIKQASDHTAKYIVFDGQGYTIDKYTAQNENGFFGYINGVVKNVKFTNATGKNAILASYLGSTDGTRPGVIDNVTVQCTLTPTSNCVGALVKNISANCTIRNCRDCSMTVHGCVKAYVGGIVGSMPAATTNSLIENCSCTVDITSTDGTNCSRIGGIIGANPYRGPSTENTCSLTIKNCSTSGTIAVKCRYVGGIMGRAADKLLIEGCHSAVNMTSNCAEMGGILGASEDTGTNVTKDGVNTIIRNCSSEGNLTSSYNTITDKGASSGEPQARLGGIVGYGYNCSVYNCTSSAALSTTGKGSRIGGIVGFNANYSAQGGQQQTIEKCAFTGTINSTTKDASVKNIGGIAGEALWTKISKCYSTGAVNGGYRFIGGIVGAVSSSSVVEDCWASGSVSAGDRCVGGVVGFASGYTTIRRNYSTAVLTAPYVIGGIIGTAGYGSQTVGRTVPVTNCIAWQTAITATTKDQTISSGAITGYMAADLTVSGCYRNPELSFTDTREAWTLFDQPDSKNADEYSAGNPDQANGHFPYHGKAAAAGATVSEIAQTLGWSADVWDFTNDLPALKWTLSE